MRRVSSMKRLMLLAPILPLLLAGWTHAGTDAPPADVGAYLQAGAALKSALAGRHGITHEHLPGSKDGLELRADRAHPFNRGKHRNRVHDDGLAYAAGDSVIVSAVVVSRREIDIVLGLGGYDPKNLAGTANSTSTSQQQALEWQIRLAAAKEGIPTANPNYVYYENLTDEARETRVRELESKRGATIKASEDAALAERQMMKQRLARIAGSRIRLLYDHDVPLADLDEHRLRAMIAPYVTLAE